MEQSPFALNAPDPARKWIFVAAIAALVLKLLLAFNTFGTNDVASFYNFGRHLSTNGLEWLYTNAQLHAIATNNGVELYQSSEKAFNHPPLVAYYLQFIYRLSHVRFYEQNNLSFPFLLRLPGILADLFVILLLARSQTQLRLPTWSLIALALSPVSFMVSGFHGNTDPVVVFFLVLAAIMCLRDAPLSCGVALAVSCQIKIIPLLLVPVFAFFWFERRKALFFAVPFSLVSALLCLQPLLKFPSVLFSNVLGYSSFWGCWGITYWLRMTGTRISPWSVTTICPLRRSS